MPDDLDREVARLRETWGRGRLVWIAGSTHPGEDEIVLDAHRALQERFPGLLLILAPRHTDRTDGVVDLSVRRGLRTVRLSESPGGEASHAVDVLVANVMGRLLYLYGVADLALLGGSLVPIGGHNPIEAALHGMPMLMGPHRFNWTEIARRFADAGCLHLVRADDLAGLAGDLLADEERRRREGREARAVVAANRGASGRLVGRMEAIVSPPAARTPAG